MVKLFYFLILLLVVCSNATTYVAILETIVDSTLAETISASDQTYLTDALRSEAVNALPEKEGFTVMSREDIQVMLPANTTNEAGTGNYIVEVGDSLVANYALQARVGKFNSSFVLFVEMYEVTEAKRVASFGGIGNGVGFLLETVKQKAPNFYKSGTKKAKNKDAKAKDGKSKGDKDGEKPRKKKKKKSNDEE